MFVLYKAHEIAPQWFRRHLWKFMYDFVARYRPEEFAFMNLGYMPGPGEGSSTPQLGVEELPAEMYSVVGRDAHLSGARVLEVGSGRGGGASLLTKEFKPASYVGLDRSATAIQASTKRYAAIPNLRFVVGDAEQLPFPSASFDVVLNVESSHCYGDFPAFVREVARVLVDGGRFAWADIHSRDRKSKIEETFKKEGFQIREEHDITASVVAALKTDLPRYRHMLGTRLWLESGRVWRRLEQREMLFTRCILEKPSMLSS